MALRKIAPGVRDDLAVDWMIGGFDADDLGFAATVVFMKISEKFEFRRRRSDQEDRIGSLERARHLFEEMIRVGPVVLRLAVTLWAAVNVVLRSEYGGLLGRIRVHMKHSCFGVVEPDDGICGHVWMF
jgi:hypothetical protein